MSYVKQFALINDAVHAQAMAINKTMLTLSGGIRYEILPESGVPFEDEDKS